MENKTALLHRFLDNLAADRTYSERLRELTGPFVWEFILDGKAYLVELAMDRLEKEAHDAAHRPG